MRAVLLLGRFGWLSLVGLVYGLRYAVLRFGTLWIDGEDRYQAAIAKLRGRTLRRAMEKLGPTFIKLGQVMSTRRDLFPPEMIEELRQLQDHIPPFSAAEMRRTVDEDLGRHVFETLDDEPIAAASVAQVHRGTLRIQGEDVDVAVKVLRPDVRQRIERDATILRTGAKLLALHPALKLSDPLGHLEHFIGGILDQTDLRIEAENSAQFHENFHGFEGVVFPRIFEEACSERVLTMEFFEGTKVDELAPGDHSQLTDRLARAFMKMCFEDGFLHADLHPGNFLALADGRVGIFDVGLAKRLDDDLLTEFVDFTKCMVMGTSVDMTAHMKHFHTYMEGVDWDAMEVDMASLVTKFRGQTKSELEMGAMFDEMFALGRKYRVRPRTELTLIIVGMITAEGVGKMLDPDSDMFAQTAEFLLPILARRGLLPVAMS